MWKAISEHPIESVRVLLYMPSLVEDIDFPGHAFMIADEVIWDFQTSQKWYAGATHWMHITPDGWRDLLEDPPHPDASSILTVKRPATVVVSNARYPLKPENQERDKIFLWKPIPCPPGYKELEIHKNLVLNTSPPTYFYD